MSQLLSFNCPPYRAPQLTNLSKQNKTNKQNPPLCPSHSDFVGSRVYACLDVTCHLHYWQNDQGLLSATAETQGWNRHQTRESAHKVNSGKEHSPTARGGIQTCNLPITSPVLLPTSYSINSNTVKNTLEVFTSDARLK